MLAGIARLPLTSRLTEQRRCLFQQSSGEFHRRRSLRIGWGGVGEAPEGLYHAGMLTKLRERGDKIEDGVPDQELQRRFETFRGRECVLPEALAAHRKGGAK